MKVSVNLMKQFSDSAQWKLGLPELVEKIGAQLGAVEETVDLSHKYDGILIAQVVACAPHANSDHMHVCKIDDGGKAKDVPRDKDGYVQVVCGAPNVRAGLTVVWLPPGSTVPSSFGKEPFVLGARELRGELSNGMLASGKELDINDNHDGIIEVDIQAKPGTLFADAYKLAGDAVIDVENKMFTHRPDCFGNLGVAREIAGIQGLPFESPDWYTLDAELPKPTGTPLKLTVKNEIPDLVPRYMAVVLDDITIRPSPVWLQATLKTLGIRAINNVVDITNYMMILTGQPMHAFDYDKVADATVVVRKPKKDETLELLDGKKIALYKDAMLICDSQKAIGLGGMMGGANSEIGPKTKRIILECATFDMYTIRRTSMHHGVFTDAVTRYSKGQSPLQTAPILAKAVAELVQATGGRVASEVVDSYAKPHNPKAVILTEEFVNKRLGTSLKARDMATALNNVEFAVEERGDELAVTPPFWRTDIEIAEDVVEEIGRLQGYGLLPKNLPMRDTSAVTMPEIDELKMRIRNLLAQAGANELQTYSFVPARLLQQVGQDKKHAFAIRNALSPELEHYRLSLTPSLLEKVHSNVKAGYKQFGLFEINKIHLKSETDVDCDGLPREYQTLAFVFASDGELPGAAYYYAKHYLDYVLRELGVTYTVQPATKAPGFEIGRQVFAPFEPKRSAYVYAGDGDFTGFVGEYRTAVSKNLKLPKVCAGFEIDLERVLKHQHARRYQQLLKFPATEQDVCLKVKQAVAYAELQQLVVDSLTQDERLRVTIAPLDIYQRENDTTRKQITFRIKLQHADRTLATTDVNDMLDAMVAKVDAAIGAERI